MKTAIDKKLSCICVMGGSDEKRMRNFKGFLYSIKRQSFQEYEFILVEIVYNNKKQYNSYFCDKYIPLNSDGKWYFSWGKNVGVKNADTERILFLEGDTIFNSSYFETVYDYSEQKNCFLAWNKAICLTEKATKDCLTDIDFSILSNLSKDDISQIKTPSYKGGSAGLSQFFRKDFYWEIGGSDEGCYNWGGDDNNLMCRAAAFNDNKIDRMESEIYHLKHEQRRRSEINYERLDFVQKKPRKAAKLLTDSPKGSEKHPITVKFPF